MGWDVWMGWGGLGEGERRGEAGSDGIISFSFRVKLLLSLPNATVPATAAATTLAPAPALSIFCFSPKASKNVPRPLMLGNANAVCTCAPSVVVCVICVESFLSSCLPSSTCFSIALLLAFLPSSPSFSLAFSLSSLLSSCCLFPGVVRIPSRFTHFWKGSSLAPAQNRCSKQFLLGPGPSQ